MRKNACWFWARNPKLIHLSGNKTKGLLGRHLFQPLKVCAPGLDPAKRVLGHRCPTVGRNEGVGQSCETRDSKPDRKSKGKTHMPEVIGAHRMGGNVDDVLRVRVADVAAYDTFYKRLTSRVCVSDISTSFVMEDIKDTTALPLG